MAESKEQRESEGKICEVVGFIDGRIETILRRYDCVADKDIIEEMVAGYEKDLLMKTRKIVFKLAVEKVKLCIMDLEREAEETKGDGDAVINDALERATPACAHMDQWELTGRRKKKYFASDTLDLFKFYDGQTDTFPKACVRKGGTGRFGGNTVCTAIVESKFPIPHLERDKGDRSRDVNEITDLGDSILDQFASTPVGESTTEVEETESESIVEDVHLEPEPTSLASGNEIVLQDEGTEAIDNRDNNPEVITPTRAEVERREATVEQPDRSAHAGVVRVIPKSTNQGTDTCTAEDIEMSVRRANEEASPVVRRYEFDHFIQYINCVLDEYNKRLLDVESCKAHTNKRVGLLEAVTLTKIPELEMGQAGLIDEMCRMKLDITDVDVRTARNTRDIGIHSDPPKDKRKDTSSQVKNLGSIWDIGSDVTSDKKGVTIKPGYVSVYAGNNNNDGVKQVGSEGSMQNPLPKYPGVAGGNTKQPSLQKQQQQQGKQKKGNQGNQAGARPKTNVQSNAVQAPKPQRNPAFNGARPKTVVQPHVTQEPKPQRSIIESFGRILRSAGATETNVDSSGTNGAVGGADTIPNEELPSKEACNNQSDVVNESWAEEISDDDIISCLDDTGSTIDAEQTTPDRKMVGERGTANTAQQNAVNVRKAVPQNNTQRGPAKKKQYGNDNRGKNGQKGRYDNNKTKGTESYAAMAAKQQDWSTPKKRKRVRSVNKKLGFLSGAQNLPQKVLYVQGIAFSRFDSYEDVEELMYVFGESRDFKFAFAKAIPVKNDNTKIGCKITVNEEDVETLLDDDFWPENITVRPWRVGPKGNKEHEGDKDNEDDNQNN